MATTLTEPRGTSMKRVAMASFVGSAIEYYDFYIYGTAAALVFPRVFFPHLGITLATVARVRWPRSPRHFCPGRVGAAFFGHFGDRLGRKSTLIATLLIMGASTFAVGLVPGALTIGMAAPMILLTLRLMQGFAVGGEWAGAVAVVRRVRPSGGPRAVRRIHSDGRRQWARDEQPAFPRGEFDDRRGQCGVPGMGVAHPVSVQRGVDRHRLVRPHECRRDAGLRRAEGARY